MAICDNRNAQYPQAVTERKLPRAAEQMGAVISKADCLLKSLEELAGRLNPVLRSTPDDPEPGPSNDPQEPSSPLRRDLERVWNMLAKADARIGFLIRDLEI